MRKKVAIIGSGITGISSAYYLGNKYDITVFEQSDRFGGHVDTHHIEDSNKKKLAIDTGFISFNKEKYPLFVKFLNELNIPFKKSDISYGFSFKKKSYGKTFFLSYLKSKHIFSGQFWLAIRDFLYFFKEIKKKENHILSIKDFIEKYSFSEVFINEFLIPTTCGILSTTKEKVLVFPIKRIYNYFNSHRLIEFFPSNKVLHVIGGYDRYIKKVLELNHITSKKNCRVQKFEIQKNKIIVKTENNTEVFDYTIICTEAHTALKILENPTKQEIDTLSPFEYRQNKAVLHSDSSIFGSQKKWPTYFVHYDKKEEKGCYTIWLNKILNLETSDNFFFTMNPYFDISREKIVKHINYKHLRVTEKVAKKQSILHSLNKNGPIYFAGSYFKYFHEDAINSAKSVVNKIKQ